MASSRVRRIVQACGPSRRAHHLARLPKTLGGKLGMDIQYLGPGLASKCEWGRTIHLLYMSISASADVLEAQHLQSTSFALVDSLITSIFLTFFLLRQVSSREYEVSKLDQSLPRGICHRRGG